MNEDIWKTLSAYRHKTFLTVAAFGVAACCSAVLIVHHFASELEHQLLDELAMSQARQLGETFVSDTVDPARAESKARILADLAMRTRDHFVAVRLIDDAGRTVSLTALPAFPEQGERFDACDRADAETQRTHCENRAADGARFLFVRVPYGESTGWFFEGIFRAAPETVRHADSVYATVVALALGALFVAIALTYPLTRFLQANLLHTGRKLLEANLDILGALGKASAKRDSDTGDHNDRVTLYAVRIAERMGLEDRDIRRLIKGALLHDVGKIAVPDAILLKPGRLDAAEMAEMRRHVAYGLEIISASEWLADAWDVVGNHHEKFDGSGYPHGLRGERIPLLARIFAVADVFDALASRRPYKEPLPVGRVLETLRGERGRHFDPAVLDAFLSLVEEVGPARCQTTGEAAKAAVAACVARYFGTRERRPASAGQAAAGSSALAWRMR